MSNQADIENGQGDLKDNWLKDTMVSLVYNIVPDASIEMIESNYNRMLKFEPFSTMYCVLTDVPMKKIMNLEAKLQEEKKANKYLMAEIAIRESKLLVAVEALDESENIINGFRSSREIGKYRYEQRLLKPKKISEG